MKKILFAVLFLSLAGMFDAGYLVYHASITPELPLPCSIFSGCDEVSKSPYSKVFGIPLSLFGFIFYTGIFALSAITLRKRNLLLLSLLRVGAGIGFLFSLYFTYLQVFVIRAYCLYCVLSALFSTLIFILSLFLREKKNTEMTEAKILLP